MALEIITNTTEFELTGATAVAIGKFDGIHIGHRRLLEEILACKDKGLKSCVFTFEPSPAVFFGVSDGKELTTKEEKRCLFERMGVDILIEFPMNRETAGTEPEQFVREVLWTRMKATVVAAGKDLSFGARGAGNAQLLQEIGAELGFEVKLIDKVCVGGQEVSSTYVREQVEAGNMETVNRLLGAPYCISGVVVKGNQLGRTIGFPTVNVIPLTGKLLPPNGVYRSQVRVDGKIYRAISNVGCKPTVSEQPVMGVESYLFEFNETIYGKEVEILLQEFRRPEKKFSTIEELQCQLMADIKEIQSISG